MRGTFMDEDGLAAPLVETTPPPTDEAEEAYAEWLSYGIPTGMPCATPEQMERDLRAQGLWVDYPANAWTG